jgi:UrcA family protein
MNKLLCTVAAAAALAAGAAQAQPAAAGSVYTASVRHADLNLASAEGLATFRGRVEAAAERTCGTASLPSVSDAQSVRACRAALGRSAAARIQPFLRTGTAEVLGTH